MNKSRSNVRGSQLARRRVRQQARGRCTAVTRPTTVAAFDLCARRVYRFVDAANSPSCSSFSLSAPSSSWCFVPSLFSFLSPYLVLVLRELIIYITVEKSAFQPLCCYPKKNDNDFPFRLLVEKINNVSFATCLFYLLYTY